VVHAGYLVSVDAYMNLQLASTGGAARRISYLQAFAHMTMEHQRHAVLQAFDPSCAEEWIDGQCTGNLGEVLIR
jgi:small nuclear ribonucleoprotein (snRNP)-like protein